MNNIKLYQGDCLTIMPELSDKSVDMILTDLPYGSTSCSWDVIIPFEDLWNQYNRIIKSNGCIALFGSEPFSSYLRLSNINHYKYDLYWVKEKPVNFFQLKRRFGKTTENICIFYKNQPTYNPQMIKHLGKKVTNKSLATFNSITSGRSKSTIQPYQDTGYRYPCDTLKFNRVPPGKTIHETQKPQKLLEYLIQTYTNTGEVVLDSCMGSGSTGLACLSTKRKFIGIEKNEEYFNKASAYITHKNQGNEEK